MDLGAFEPAFSCLKCDRYSSYPGPTWENGPHDVPLRHPTPMLEMAIYDLEMARLQC